MRSNLKLSASLPICAILFTLSLCSTAFAAHRPAPAARPDLPLERLIGVAYSDINTYWQQVFAQSGRRYVPPQMYYYVQPVNTPCGVAMMDNAFYCAPANTIYYDYGFFSKMYSRVGDYAVVSIIAHEWGHLVQAQLGISRGNYYNIQLELQADCAAGMYTRYAEAKRELDDGDLEEAGSGLFNSGDPSGMPWFAAQAHGKPMQRVNFFLSGYNGGVCFPS